MNAHSGIEEPSMLCRAESKGNPPMPRTRIRIACMRRVGGVAREMVSQSSEGTGTAHSARLHNPVSVLFAPPLCNDLTERVGGKGT